MVDRVENGEILSGDKGKNDESTVFSGKTFGESPQGIAGNTIEHDSATPDKKKKRKHRKYKTAINLPALKELEGTTAGSFLDLSKAVILIDGKPYDEECLALSKERKNDFRRLIEHYAVIDVIGKRKYYIKRVYSKEQREELNRLELLPDKIGRK